MASCVSSIPCAPLPSFCCSSPLELQRLCLGPQSQSHGQLDPGWPFSLAQTDLTVAQDPCQQNREGGKGVMALGKTP